MRAKEERRTDDTRQQGKGGRENEMTEGGPMLVNHMAVKESGAARTPLIWAPRSRPLKRCTWEVGPPPSA
jgi:hypothetical protein